MRGPYFRLLCLPKFKTIVISDDTPRIKSLIKNVLIIILITWHMSHVFAWINSSFLFGKERSYLLLSLVGRRGCGTTVFLFEARKICTDKPEWAGAVHKLGGKPVHVHILFQSNLTHFPSVWSRIVYWDAVISIFFLHWVHQNCKWKKKEVLNKTLCNNHMSYSIIQSRKSLGLFYCLYT
jgi:hypothetical protein